MADAALTPEDFDLLAAELALGVLDGAERARALRLQLSDAAFRQAVTDWHQRFEALLHDYQDVAPPDLWQAIEQRLSQAGQDAPVSSLKAWRIGALATGALAAGLATVLLFRPAAQPPAAPGPAIVQATPPIVARLGDGENAHQLIASFDTASGQMHIRALKMPPSDLAPELWVIPADNVPRSLGLVVAQGSTRVAVQPAIRALLRDGVTLAVTMEKREGAPHAAPSSAPVAVGQMHAL